VVLIDLRRRLVVMVLNVRVVNLYSLSILVVAGRRYHLGPRVGRKTRPFWYLVLMYWPFVRVGVDVTWRPGVGVGVWHCVPLASFRTCT
jgi:hypothetical protein